VVVPARTVVVTVLPVAVPPIALASTKPDDTSSVIVTVPGAIGTPGAQTEAVDSAGTVMG